MVELQKLCDKVPSYDSKIAFATIEKELGKPVLDVYSEISPEPLAAASLGQVYKATLRSNNATVAVKVQRPGVLETVSLDLYLARELGNFLNQFPFLAERTDIVALLDEFAYRFYDELDYEKECQYGIQIKKDMEHIKQVVVPFNYPEFTRRRVFTAEWIEGEKLSQSRADDVGELVEVGVLAYLTQLLDTGFFHSDPHPGNLIRTPEGKLAILDFGLMTQVTDDQKYGMVEAISHLVHRDYKRIGNDFKQLDFIPQYVDVEPIIPALSKVFDQALAGGGAKSINFQELASDLATITFEYPFRIPPYFALIIRAIGVLEGIALNSNPDFAIIDEAYPFLSKKLLTDDSPRLREALRYLIYGEGNVFDVERLIDLLQAFEQFAAVRDDRKSEAGQDSSVPYTRDESSQAREALRFLFSDDGEFFRQFLEDEVVKGADALGRDAARELAFSIGLRGPLVPDVLRAALPKVEGDDRKVVDNTRRLLAFFLGDLGQSFAANDRVTPYNPSAGLFGLRLNLQPAQDLLGLARDGRASSLQRELAPVLQEMAPEMRSFGLRIVGRLTDKLASRVLRFTSDRILGNFYGPAETSARRGSRPPPAAFPATSSLAPPASAAARKSRFYS
jgi:aarF domain-containing kinase